jgi:cytochrome c oxidase subunit 3
MIMFIASEVMFFVAWFWAFFDASLFANEAQQVLRTEYSGGQWPPKGLEVLDPLHLPLFNTIILLLSGTTLTWAHHALIHGDNKTTVNMLWITVGLGVFFSFVQAYEYAHAPFAFTEGIYSSTFFLATGFHGFHVLVGTIFLIVCLVRAIRHSFTTEKHFGFEAAAWYWHFVDVVWLFLFFAIYIWGSWGAEFH